MKPASFEEIISFENLLKAHQRVRCCKQHKKEVIGFEMHLSRNLWALHYDLKYHKYQIGKGTDYAIKLLRQFMVKHYRKYFEKGYFVKLDIKKYFPNINHEVLYEKLAKYKFDKDTEWLLHTVIDSYGNGKGLPMGNQSSQCFALLYLDRIDRIIKEKLELNHKSQIIKMANGVEFLGWKFSFGKNGKIIQKVKNQSKKRIFHKVRKIFYEKKMNLCSQEVVMNSLTSYKGHLLRGNDWCVYNKIYEKRIK